MTGMEPKWLLIMYGSKIAFHQENHDRNEVQFAYNHMSVKHEFSIILIKRIMTEWPLNPDRSNNKVHEENGTKNEAQMASDPYQRNIFFMNRIMTRKKSPYGV